MKDFKFDNFKSPNSTLKKDTTSVKSNPKLSIVEEPVSEYEDETEKKQSPMKASPVKRDSILKQNETPKNKPIVQKPIIQ